MTFRSFSLFDFLFKPIMVLVFICLVLMFVGALMALLSFPTGVLLFKSGFIAIAYIVLVMVIVLVIDILFDN